jgi:hypothetical protein
MKKMTNIEKYLNKVVDYVMKHPPNRNTTSFNDYCNHTFGLTDDETDYVYYRYKTLMGWVSDDDGASQYYLKKILKDY